MASPLLSCRDLHVSFLQDEGVGRAVRGVSFEVEPSRTLGIVGESGCGKSVTALSCMRLIQCPPGRIERGSVTLGSQELLTLPERRMRTVRGRDISMIFQDPMTSLNPVYTCGWQICEAVTHHLDKRRGEAEEMALTMLDKVGIPHPRAVLAAYPHQLSGGMRQRVMIAMALVCGPMLLIADEPTTALDVTVQARILDLLLSLQESLQMSMIMITHDLGIVADVAHEIMVMYAGIVVERAPVRSLFDTPRHPYTQALLSTIPYLDRDQKRLEVIPGEVPNPITLPPGCPFHPRCSRRMDRCSRLTPRLIREEEGHAVRCFLHHDASEEDAVSEAPL